MIAWDILIRYSSFYEGRRYTSKTAFETTKMILDHVALSRLAVSIYLFVSDCPDVRDTMRTRRQHEILHSLVKVIVSQLPREWRHVRSRPFSGKNPFKTQKVINILDEITIPFGRV